MSFTKAGDVIKKVLPRLAPMPDFSAPAESKKVIVVTVSGPEAALIAPTIWQALTEAAAKIMEHHKGNVVSLSGHGERDHQ